ncbi:MAG TPA: hypothetical protein PLY43_00365 [Ruminococcus sp.]|nr:hypothetical protein [Ruminococcus sp.]
MMSISQQEFVRALDGLIDEIVTKTVKEHVDDLVEKNIQDKLDHRFNALWFCIADEMDRHIRSRADSHVPSRDEIRKLVYDILSDTSFSPNLPPKI